MKKRIVVFDMDGTLGYFSQLSILFKSIENYINKQLSQNQFDSIMNLYKKELNSQGNNNEDDNESDVISNRIELSLSQLWQPELSKVPSEYCSSSIQARPSEQIRSDMRSSDNIVHIEKIPGMLEAGWTQSNYLGAIGSTGGVDFGGAPRYDSDREYTAMLSTLIQLWKEVNK